MIDLNNFFTLPNSTTPTFGAVQGDINPELAALKLLVQQNGEASEKDAEKALTIFDMLLQLAEGENDAFTAPSDAGALESDNPSLSKDAKLDLVKILAGNDRIAEEVSHLDEVAGLDLIEEIQQTLALNQQVFDNIIRAGTGNGDLQIDKETGEIVVPEVAKVLNILGEKTDALSRDINALINKLERLSQQADPAFSVTANITPEALAQAQEIALQIKNGEQPSAEDLAAIEKILSGFVAIMPPMAKSEIIIPPQALKNSGKPASLADITSNSDGSVNRHDLAARLNKLVTGGQDSNGTPLPFGAEEAAIEGDAEFELMLKEASRKQYAGNPMVAAELGTKAANNNAPNIQQPAFNVLQAWPFAGNGSLFGHAGFNDQIAEQLGISINGQQSIGQGGLTSLINHAPAAHQPHPATQIVAANIKKAGMNGQDTDISLRLDPPDLGRVDVRMTFGKDKSLKTVVTAEKPETFMMLQRDAHALERALQDAGIDADGGLSFELAEHGLDFDQHNQRGGGHDNGRTDGVSGDTDDETQIIQSTMTWHVDPETGHTRYDILA